MINKLIDLIANSFCIPRETVATILITLTIFVLGILINLLISGMKDYLQRRIHRKLSRINYILLLKGVYKQADNFYQFKKQLTIKHEGSYLYTYKILPALDVYKNLGYENLYRAYFKGFENIISLKKSKKLYAFNNLWATIAYLSHTHDDASIKVEKFIDTNAKLNDLRNLSLGKAQYIIENFRIHFNGQLGSKESLGVFFGERERIIELYGKEKDHTLAHKTEIYVQKLLKLNRENADLIRRYESDIKAVELNSHLLESSLRFENMKNHIDSNYHYFDYLSTSYKESYKKLKENYRYLALCC